MTAEMDGSTAKRRIVRRLSPVVASILAACPRSHSTTMAEMKTIASPMLDVARANGVELSGWIIIWPAGDRRHRRYILGFDNDSRPRFFTKVSSRPDDDSELFFREAAMLQFLYSSPIKGWRTPRLYHVGTGADSASITSEALPPRRRNMTWSEIFSMLPLEFEHPPAAQNAGTSGEPGFSRANAKSSESLLASGGQVETSDDTVVNGDITPSNALRSGADRWLVDWELASVSGPSGCDIVAAVISILGRRLWRTAEALSQAAVLECAAAGVSENSFARSIAYLSSVGNPTAIRLSRLNPAPIHLREGIVS